MHQSKRGKNWFFGMKAHIGVDARSGLADTNVDYRWQYVRRDANPKLLHGDETMVFGDAGNQGADKRPENKAVTFAMKRSMGRALKKNPHGRRFCHVGTVEQPICSALP